MRFIFCLLLLIGTTAAGRELVVYDSSTPTNDIVSLAKARFKQTSEGLLIETCGAQTQGATVYPGVAIKGEWNLADFNTVEVEIMHRDAKGDLPLTVRLGGEQGGVAGEEDAYIDKIRVPKKGEYIRSFSIVPAKFSTFGMRRTPWDGSGVSSKIKGQKVTSIGVYMNKPLLDWKWGVKKITLKQTDLAAGIEVSAPQPFQQPTYADYAAAGWYETPWLEKSADEFFPFIDVYGQFKYKDWPGKIHSDAQLTAAKDREDEDLAAHPGPQGWNKYGGWSDGPKFDATGHFYVKKIDGKWWLIDPEGCLYWSHGPVRVTSSSAVTPLDGRENYFENLPPEDSELGAFYKTHDDLLWPYYVKRNIQKTYDFSSANAFRKYGKDWKNIYAQRAHQRLRSWGMNTVANSSDINVCIMNQTPYTDRIELKSPPIAGSQDGWWPFRDPFHPEFRANFRRQLLERQNEINNPWCIGFFVDNELSWGSETSLGEWTLISPKDQCCKIEFVKQLKQKYQTIEELNKIWGSGYASFDALLESTVSAPQGARSDCGDFAKIIVDAYYRNIREEFKKIAPNKLYLGCRFAGGANETFLRIGAKYCDALSYNIYRFTLDEFKLPEGIDLPILIGEFHFGALDRGLFHWTLIGVRNQRERGQAYYNYVESALKHPNFIGVHWHQFSEQPTTGRFDGEDFQNGFVDVCDTPYPETIEKIREIGYKMYQIRYGK